MTTRNKTLVLFAVVIVAGCAGRHTASSTLDAPAAAVAAVPSGTWQGVITGRELATAAGVTSQKATLKLDEGRWTMETPVGKAAGTVVASGRNIRLEGEFVEDDTGSGAPARYFLREVRPGFLAGSARSYFSGHGIDGWIVLDRVE